MTVKQESQHNGESTHVENKKQLGDIATQLVDNYTHANITPQQDRQCLRRVDLVLMPVMFFSFALQYLDKACLTGAVLFGILTDLDLVKFTTDHGKLVVDTRRYSYCSLIFYWGYLVGMVPGVYLCQRFPLGKYVAVIMFLWGGITVCTVAVHSYQGLLIQRFFLGVAEAGLAPAFSLITAMWYKRREQPLRFAIWFSAAGIGVLLGSLLFFGIGHIKGRLAPWQYQFMIIGSISSIWGIALWFVLPDSPLTASFLSQDMKVVAVERMRLEQIGIENKTIKKEQIKEAFTDPKTYFYVILAFTCNLANGAATGFGSVIVQSFGYTPLKTILLLGVAGVTVFLSALAAGLISVTWRNRRCYCAMFCCLPVIAGCVLIWKSNWQHKSLPLWGFFIVPFFSTAYLMVLSVVAANTAGHTKKAVTAGLVWGSYSISNGVAPLLVRTQEQSTHYPTAFITIMSLMVFTFFLIGCLRAYLFYLNKKKDDVRLVDQEAAAMTGFLDMTDRENENFRYQA